MAKKKRKPDDRPICTCGAYGFPHRIGGKCDGSVFAEHYHSWIAKDCYQCNCNHNNQCEVVTGQESIQMGECYQERLHYYPGEYLPLEP